MSNPNVPPEVAAYLRSIASRGGRKSSPAQNKSRAVNLAAARAKKAQKRLSENNS